MNLAVQVATDYRYDGRMKREGIAWFPPVWDQVQHFLRKGKSLLNMPLRMVASSRRNSADDSYHTMQRQSFHASLFHAKGSIPLCPCT
jgi:hypothetical protein